MSTKRVALGFVTAITLVIAAGFLAAPHTAWGDWGSKDRDRGRDDDDSQLASDSRVQKGFEISPVQLNLNGKRRNLVGLGSYIVNAQGGCNDCHTCPNYQPADDPYQHGSGHPNAQNYLAGGRHFGPFTSANLTPKNGLPAGLTEDQFIHVIRTGEDPDHAGQLLQVMPWPIYRNMTDRDLRAIYAFLSAIPPASPGICTGP